MGSAASQVTVDEVIDTINAAVRDRRRYRQNTDAGQPLTNSRDTLQPLQAPPLCLRPEFQHRSNSVYRLTDLLDYHDAIFIENAYRAVLGRHPDTLGMQPYLDRLRSGDASKVDIVGRLRYSREGRRKGVVVKGLLMRFLLQQSYRIPLVGYGLEWLVDLARLPGIVRRIRRFEAYSVFLTETIAEHANRSERALQTKLDYLTQRIAPPESEDSESRTVTASEEADRSR